MQSITEIINRELLGKPFRHWGRGPKHFDCLGVWMYLVRRVTGVHLPDVKPRDRTRFGEADVISLRDQLMSIGVNVRLGDQLQALDLIHHLRPGCHVYTVETPRWAVHAEFGSVGRMPMEEVLRLRNIHIWRLRELD